MHYLFTIEPSDMSRLPNIKKTQLKPHKSMDSQTPQASLISSVGALSKGRTDKAWNAQKTRLTDMSLRKLHRNGPTAQLHPSFQLNRVREKGKKIVTPPTKPTARQIVRPRIQIILIREPSNPGKRWATTITAARIQIRRQRVKHAVF